MVWTTDISRNFQQLWWKGARVAESGPNYQNWHTMLEIQNGKWTHEFYSVSDKMPKLGIPNKSRRK